MTGISTASVWRGLRRLMQSGQVFSPVTRLLPLDPQRSGAARAARRGARCGVGATSRSCRRPTPGRARAAGHPGRQSDRIRRPARRQGQDRAGVRRDRGAVRLGRHRARRGGHRTRRARAWRAPAGRPRSSAGRATTVRGDRGGSAASSVSATLAGRRPSRVGSVVESEPISLWPEEWRSHFPVRGLWCPSRSSWR